jgi:hypothetical protein
LNPLKKNQHAPQTIPCRRTGTAMDPSFVMMRVRIYEDRHYSVLERPSATISPVRTVALRRAALMRHFVNYILFHAPRLRSSAWWEKNARCASTAFNHGDTEILKTPCLRG